MESRHLLSLSKLVSRPIFANHGLEGLSLEGYRSQDFEYGKEMV